MEKEETETSEKVLYQFGDDGKTQDMYASASRLNKWFLNEQEDEEEESHSSGLGAREPRKPRVLIGSRLLPPAALNKLSHLSLRFVEAEDTPEEILQKAERVDAILLTSNNIKINSHFLEYAGDKLVVVSNMSGGWEGVDVGVLARHGVRLGAVQCPSPQMVAEVAVGHALRAAYFSSSKIGIELERRVCGVIGVGKVTDAIAEKLFALQVKSVMFCDVPHSLVLEAEMMGEDYSEDRPFNIPQDSKTPPQATLASLEDILTQADFIFLTCPLTLFTKDLLSGVELAMVSPTAVLINVTRGGVVSSSTLAECLRGHRLWGAGLDHTRPHPLPTTHPLFNLPNSYVAPGRSTAVESIQEEMAEVAVDNILAVLENRPMPAEVCFKMMGQAAEERGPKRYIGKTSLVSRNADTRASASIAFSIQDV